MTEQEIADELLERTIALLPRPMRDAAQITEPPGVLRTVIRAQSIATAAVLFKAMTVPLRRADTD